jgi:FKBP-type peptidyl-prolyl cis-trans isomerase
VKTILGAYQKLLQKQQQAKMEKESTENKAAGEAYQKEFAAKEGVKKIDNGIQYVVVKAGEGEALDPAEKVMVHYTGKFTDGTVFDTSLEPKRGRPVAPVPMAVSGARLIPAFGQVLPLMKVGSKWEVCIPAAQAYGVRGSGPRGPIGPNETLVFEIEVLEKVKAPAAKVVNPAAAEKAGSAAK